MQTWEGEHIVIVGLLGCYFLTAYLLLGIVNVALKKPIGSCKRLGFAALAGAVGTLTTMFEEVRIVLVVGVFIGSFWAVKNLPGLAASLELSDDRAPIRKKKYRPISARISNPE